MTYVCPSCGYAEDWTEKDFAEKGEPVCPGCDDDMKPKAENSLDSLGGLFESVDKTFNRLKEYPTID